MCMYIFYGGGFLHVVFFIFVFCGEGKKKKKLNERFINKIVKKKIIFVLVFER